MELDLQTTSQDLSHSNFLDHISYGVAHDQGDMPVTCGLCGRTLSFEDEVNSLQTAAICDDCKFLLLEDFGTPVNNSLRRRLSGRRSAIGFSDSVENFSQNFSEIINLARHLEPENGHVHGDSDPNVMLQLPSSSRTTPNGSSRWRRVLSDTESDGFISDSFYGESESSFSVGAYMVYHGDSDALSFSTFDGDSGASVDSRSYFDTDMYVQSMERIDIDSESDIDPMHAGVVHWNSDEHDVEDGEWREINVMPQESRDNFNSNDSSDHIFEHSRTNSFEFEGMNLRRLREVGDFQNPSIHMSMGDIGEAHYSDNAGDYLDAQGFDEILEHLSATDNSRRGAPPAALSFIDNLPLFVISDEHQKHDSLSCAICKDLFMIGTEVNQLPCFHLYHPACILPWLNARNSCPLCRYELPTDDRVYERGKHNASHGIVSSETQQQEDRDDSSSVISDSSEMDEAQDFAAIMGDASPAAELSRTNGRRGGWLLLAAAPIVSLAGIVFVLWLGNPLAERRALTEKCNLHGCPSQPKPIHTSGSCPRNQQEKRWWWWS